MSVELIRENSNEIVVQLTIPVNGSMLQAEDAIKAALNEAGALATERKILYFDTDGSPIRVGGVKFTSKGKSGQQYETPYGPIHIERHTYQTNLGGKTWCPLEERVRTVLNATPRHAKSVSFKYAQSGARAVVEDMLEHDRVSISDRYVKMLGDAVGMVASSKEEVWEYALPELEAIVASVGVGIDGAYMLMVDDGWREAMTGTISLYDSRGERLHTIYVGATPEYGKEKFHARFTRELDRVKSQFGDIPYVGLGDGASGNWTYLTPLTNVQVLDFYHATEYLGNASSVVLPGKKNDAARKEWMHDRCHRLKHEASGAKHILEELKSHRNDVNIRPKLKKEQREVLDATIGYFENQLSKMSYWRYIESCYPIGSGVTEAGCKTLIKSRFCGSGSRWQDRGASFVMSIRALRLTPHRWQSFWTLIDQYGLPSNVRTTVK